MASLRSSALCLAVALAAPEAVQAFAPASLRAFGAAKAALPARTCKAAPMKMVVAQWKEVLDAESGDVYYWNTVTGETSWDKPKAEAPRETGPLSRYNGNGKFLDDAAVAALPKPESESLMPGYNVFGDAMFFGEGMLKGEMLDSWGELELDNWGNPLPNASEATIQKVNQAKVEAKMKELENKSTYPQNADSTIPK